MAIAPTQIAQLRAALRRLGASHSATMPTASGRAMEAWVMMRVARRAAASGRWRVSLRRGDASLLPPGGTFVFPTQQGGIAAANPSGPGHVRFEQLSDPSHAFEMHNSLQWIGRSGASHECDLSILPKTIAHRLRSHPGHPRGLPLAALECKDRPGKASTDEMRETLARMFDLALVTRPQPGWDCRMYELSGPTLWGSHKPKYIPLFWLGAFAVIRAGGFGAGSRNIGHHYHVARLGLVYTDPRSIVLATDTVLWALDQAPAM